MTGRQFENLLLALVVIGARLHLALSEETLFTVRSSLV